MTIDVHNPNDLPPTPPADAEDDAPTDEPANGSEATDNASTAKARRDLGIQYDVLNYLRNHPDEQLTVAEITRGTGRTDDFKVRATLQQVRYRDVQDAGLKLERVGRDVWRWNSMTEIRTVRTPNPRRPLKRQASTPTEVVCPDCGKSFPSRQALGSHKGKTGHGGSLTPTKRSHHRRVDLNNVNDRLGQPDLDRYIEELLAQAHELTDDQQRRLIELLAVTEHAMLYRDAHGRLLVEYPEPARSEPPSSAETERARDYINNLLGGRQPKQPPDTSWPATPEVRGRDNGADTDRVRHVGPDDVIPLAALDNLVERQASVRVPSLSHSIAPEVADAASTRRTFALVGSTLDGRLVLQATDDLTVWLAAAP